MIRVDNPALDRLVLNHLADLYGIKARREGTHLSTLVYCLTRGFFDQKQPIEPTDEEVMLFALGLGLQDVLTPTHGLTPVYELDGITFSPDFQFELDSFYCELKTTRMSLKKCIEGGLPETWVEYIAGGCYIRGVRTYELSVLYMLGSYSPPFPQIHSETLAFDDDELQANWDYILGRKAIYEEALQKNVPPEPFKHCKNWECKNCRYKVQCTAIQLLTQRDIKKEV